MLCLFPFVVTVEPRQSTHLGRASVSLNRVALSLVWLAESKTVDSVAAAHLDKLAIADVCYVPPEPMNDRA